MPRREVLDAPGLFKHENPIPTAVKMGSFIFSSALPGFDPETQSTPDDPRQQVTLAFEQMRRVVEAGGGTLQDIAKVTVFLKDLTHRSMVNEEWLKMFPDAADRPVRHTMQHDLPQNYLVQLEFTAVL
jgi:2-iminobutanoate/2-iminopropanoate deaminase